ncbi:MAG: YciI family protein [Actinomycetota bacterium]
MRYVVIARDGTDPQAKARRLAVRPAHLERVGPFVERGRVLLGGAILDDAGDMVGSVLLLDFATRQEVDAWIAEDPYVTGGVWRHIEVRDFRPAVGAWLPDG